MQLTGKEIVNKGIITNYCQEGVQQQGIDVRVDKVFSISSSGSIPARGKTVLPDRYEIMSYVDDNKYHLDPGYYELELIEGCEIPCDAVLNFKTRSSLVRCGALVHSGQFDAGFKTDRMGCFLQVLLPITIERGSRIAQAIVTQTANVDDESLYSGQWQGDKQRK